VLLQLIIRTLVYPDTRTAHFFW